MKKIENTDYKKAVLELMDKVNDDDIIFLRRIYTIIKRHIEKQRSLT